MTPCGSCGQRPAPPPTRVAPAPTSAPVPAGVAGTSDGDYVKVKYLSLNTGQHSVVGAATKIKYGYRAGGDELLIHKDDLAAQPHLFKPVLAPAPEPTPPPPPPAPEPAPEPVETAEEVKDEVKIEVKRSRPPTARKPK